MTAAVAVRQPGWDPALGTHFSQRATLLPKPLPLVKTDTMWVENMEGPQFLQQQTSPHHHLTKAFCPFFLCVPYNHSGKECKDCHLWLPGHLESQPSKVFWEGTPCSADPGLDCRHTGVSVRSLHTNTQVAQVACQHLNYSGHSDRRPTPSG